MLPEELLNELQGKMSLTRLAKIGLFQKLKLSGEEPEDIVKMIHLHRAVLDKALVDYFHVLEKHRKAVEEWLHLDNPDFIEACERAVLEPKLVYKTFKLMKNILIGSNASFKKLGPRKKKSRQ